MKRAFHKNSGALPRLASDPELGLSLNEKTAEVFTPSAIRDHKPPVSMKINRTFAAILFALFVVVLLLSFLMGINVYQSLNSMSTREDTTRLEQSFLANTIHSNDMKDAVAVGQGPEGKSLVLLDRVDGVGTYETRIYSYEGAIVQEYSLQGNPYMPEKAITITESNTFDFSYSNGLLTVVTDNGSVTVALRSSEGGER